MGTRSGIAIGVFSSREEADGGVRALEHASFPVSDIGIIARGTADWRDIREHANTRVAVGSAKETGMGGLWELRIAGWVLPTIGPIIAGGVLGDVLQSGAASTVAGALSGLGVYEEEAARYQSAVEAGRIVVTVKAAHRFHEAREILRNCGATVYSVRSVVYA